MDRLLKIGVMAMMVYFSGLSAAEAAISEPIDWTVNINTASIAQLTKLPGIGMVKATEIVRYRSKHRFSEPSELLKVEGITPRVYRLIVDKVMVEGPSYPHLSI